jgi:hypothetical protein
MGSDSSGSADYDAHDSTDDDGSGRTLSAIASTGEQPASPLCTHHTAASPLTVATQVRIHPTSREPAYRDLLGANRTRVWGSRLHRPLNRGAWWWCVGGVWRAQAESSEPRREEHRAWLRGRELRTLAPASAEDEEEGNDGRGAPVSADALARCVREVTYSASVTLKPLLTLRPPMKPLLAFTGAY